MRPFAAQIAYDHHLVYDIRGTVKGEQRYFILHVEPARHAAFLKKIASGAGCNPQDYGEILYRGWDEPPEPLKQKLHEKYGMYAHGLLEPIDVPR